MYNASWNLENKQRSSKRYIEQICFEEGTKLTASEGSNSWSCRIDGSKGEMFMEFVGMKGFFLSNGKQAASLRDSFCFWFDCLSTRTEEDSEVWKEE